MPRKKVHSFSDVHYPYREKYLTLNNGMKICYIDKGMGTPLVFVHGMGGDLSNFTYNYKHFKRDFRVIGLDLPGYGKSGRQKTDYTIEYYAGVLEEFLAKLSVDKCILIGNSLGGHISAVYALKDQSRVEKLILVDSAGLTKLSPVLETMVKFTLNTTVLKMSPMTLVNQGLKNNFHDTDLKECKEWLDNIANISANDEEYENYCHSIKCSVKTMLQSRIDHEIGKLDIPVLLVWGKYDCMVPLNYAYQFKSKVKNSKLVIIDDAGHMPMLEKYSAFNKIMEEFIMANRKNFFIRIKEILFD